MSTDEQHLILNDDHPERKRKIEDHESPIKRTKQSPIRTDPPQIQNRPPNHSGNQLSEIELLKNLKSSGIYIPPHKKVLQTAPSVDTGSIEYQKIVWEALKKAINGIINKVSISNVKSVIPELFRENLVRGRGLFCRAMIKAQQASPSFTNVYTSIIAVINSKMPETGELIIKRVVSGFRRAYQRNDKGKCLGFAQFIAHLVNQNLVHAVLAGQVLGLLLEKPSDDSVELAVTFTKECGSQIHASTPKILNAVFERFRGILHEGEIEKRVQYLIEGLFAARKKNFIDFPAVLKELDLVDINDQITHEIELDDQFDLQETIDYFAFDKDFDENNAQYEMIRNEILGAPSEGEQREEETTIVVEPDNVVSIETSDKDLIDSVNHKKQIYLTIMSSINFEETVHKLVKAGLTEGREMEVCQMIIECCAQERTHIRYYGLMAQRFCYLDKIFQERFDECFKHQYSLIHRLDTNKLRNVAKFFAHLLYSDSLSWSVMEYIHLNEEETSSSSRIFIKILFQELCENLGLRQLNDRLNDQFLRAHYKGIFPTDSAKNMRFAINFFTSIGLGGLTQDLRDLREQLAKAPSKSAHDSDSSDSDSDDSSSNSSSSDSDSD